MIIQNVGLDGKTDLSFTVAKTDLLRAIDACEAVKII